MDKKGFTMPLVLVFMVLSQIIFVGILAIEQAQLRHHRVMQNYYQAHTMAHMSSRLLDNHFREHEGLLKKQIIEQFGELHQRWQRHFTQAELLSTGPEDQYRLYQTGPDDASTLVLIYHDILFIDQPPRLQVIDPLFHQTIPANEVSRQGYRQHVGFLKDDRIQEIKKTLTEQHWSLQSEQTATHRYRFELNTLPFSTLTFNHGSLTFQFERGHLAMKGDNPVFRRGNSIPFPQGNYLIYSQLYTFTYDSSGNN